MLNVRDLHVYYNKIQALRGVSLDVESGEFVAILGPNGAGKSTLIKAIIGVLAPRSGDIILDGTRINAYPVAHRIQQGIGIIPEGRQLFPDLTVRENLILGAYAKLTFKIVPAIAERLETVCTLFPRLRERQSQPVGSLSGGEAQMVAIGRALMSQPSLLLCDEPSLGLAPLLVREMLGTLGKLRESGITILLADQNALATLRIADRAYVLDSGQIVASGTSRELEHNEQLRTAYLGMGGDS